LELRAGAVNASALRADRACTGARLRALTAPARSSGSAATWWPRAASDLICTDGSVWRPLRSGAILRTSRRCSWHLLAIRRSDSEHFWSTLHGLDRQQSRSSHEPQCWPVSRTAPHLMSGRRVAHDRRNGHRRAPASGLRVAVAYLSRPAAVNPVAADMTVPQNCCSARLARSKRRH